MNRWTNQFAGTLEKRVIKLFARVTFGASGAPTLSAVNSKGIISVTRTAQGNFTFVFGTNTILPFDTYVKVMQVGSVFNSGSAPPAAPGIYIKTDNTAVAGTCSMAVVLTSAAGTATDPASGEIGYFEFTFGDSTAP